MLAWVYSGLRVSLLALVASSTIVADEVMVISGRIERGDLTIGTSYSFMATLDRDAPDLLPDPVLGLFWALPEFELVVTDKHGLFSNNFDQIRVRGQDGLINILNGIVSDLLISFEHTEFNTITTTRDGVPVDPLPVTELYPELMPSFTFTQWPLRGTGAGRQPGCRPKWV